MINANFIQSSFLSHFSPFGRERFVRANEFRAVLFLTAEFLNKLTGGVPMERNTTEKFSGIAQVYAKSRPAYPQELVELLARRCPPEENDAADIGAGTGIFTRQLLEAGYRVAAVEPNRDMRETLLREAEEGGWDQTRLSVLDGSDRDTHLPSHTVGLITAAQAFHWFEPLLFREECRRIGRPGVKAALIWNSRVESDPAVQKWAEVCRRFCPEFTGFSGGKGKDGEGRREKNLRLFFEGLPPAEEISLPFFQRYTLEEFLGRGLASSYAPRPEEKNYRPYQEALAELFAAEEEGGRLSIPYLCQGWLCEPDRVQRT